MENLENKFPEHSSGLVLRLDALLEVYGEYDKAHDESSRLLFLDSVYEDGQPKHMNDEEWQDFIAEHPRPAQEEIKRLSDITQAKREAVFNNMPIADSTQRDRVLLALKGLDTNRVTEVADLENLVFVGGYTADYEHDWYSTLDGLITLAQLTGETFHIYQGGIYEKYNFGMVDAYTPRPEIPERYDPEYWSELHTIHYGLGRYVRELFPYQYKQKDPTLLEKHQNIVDRLQSCQGEPILACTTLAPDAHSTSFEMGLILSSDFNLRYGGDEATTLGGISVAASGTQSRICDAEHPKGYFRTMPDNNAKGQISIESLLKFHGEFINPYQGDVELFIGNQEIDEYIAQHPDHAEPVEDMLKHYMASESE